MFHIKYKGTSSPLITSIFVKSRLLIILLNQFKSLFFTNFIQLYFNKVSINRLFHRYKMVLTMFNTYCELW